AVRNCDPHVSRYVEQNSGFPEHLPGERKLGLAFSWFPGGHPAADGATAALRQDPLELELAYHNFADSRLCAVAWRGYLVTCCRHQRRSVRRGDPGAVCYVPVR